MEVNELASELEKVRDAVAHVVVGYDEVVVDLLVGLLSRGHVLLEGVPGLAKTTLAKTFATATGLSFNRVQFTQDLLPADITGHYFYDRSQESFELRAGPVFSQILLADEINRAPPKTQSALLEAMEERQVTIEGDTYRLPAPFMVIATMNPVDVDGVYRLPEAQLDRFMLRTEMGYLSDEQERTMLSQKARPGGLDIPEIDADLIHEAQERLDEVHVSAEVIGYIQAIGQATRDHPTVDLGASPRAMEQMLKASQALALLSGRDHVLPDDVKGITPSVLSHRLILDVDAEIEGLGARDILAEILEATEVPKGFDQAPVEDPPRRSPGDRQTGRGPRADDPDRQGPGPRDRSQDRSKPSAGDRRGKDGPDRASRGHQAPAVRDGRQLLDPPQRRFPGPPGSDQPDRSHAHPGSTQGTDDPASSGIASASPGPDSQPVRHDAPAGHGQDPATRPDPPARAEAADGSGLEAPAIEDLDGFEEIDLDTLPPEAEVTETTYRKVVEEDGRRITVIEQERIVDHGDRRTRETQRQRTIGPIDDPRPSTQAPEATEETRQGSASPASSTPNRDEDSPSRGPPSPHSDTPATPPGRSSEPSSPDPGPRSARPPAANAQTNQANGHADQANGASPGTANGNGHRRPSSQDRSGVRFPVVERRPPSEADATEPDPGPGTPMDPGRGAQEPATRRATSQAGNYRWPPPGWHQGDDGTLVRDDDPPAGSSDPSPAEDPDKDRDKPPTDATFQVHEGTNPEGLGERLISATADLLDKLTDQTRTDR